MGRRDLLVMGGGGAGIKFSKSKRSSRKNVVKHIRTRQKINKERKKMRKASKDDSVKFRFERKDPGIPNKWPMKAKMLQEASENRAKARDNYLQKQAAKRADTGVNSSEEEDDVVPDLEA